MPMALVLFLCLLLVATGSSRPSKEDCKCENLKDINYRIANGTRGPQLEQGLPWIAFLFKKIRKDDFLMNKISGPTSSEPMDPKLFEVGCTAFVIGTHWVLTAAHCIGGEFYSNQTHQNLTPVVYVGAGLDHNVTKIVANPKNSRKVKEFYKPPAPKINKTILEGLDENSEMFLIAKNDIALLEMEEPWTFDEQTRIKPACLMGFNRDHFEDTFLAAGYGAKDNKELLYSHRSASNYNLSELTMTKLSLFNLTRYYFGMNSSFSAGCPGDSGSPLQYYQTSDNTLYVVGVASYGPESEDQSIQRCSPGRAMMYVAIYQHLKWIRNLTQDDLCAIDSPDDDDLIRNLTTQNDFGTTNSPDDKDLISNLTTQNDFGTTDSPDDEDWIRKRGLILFLVAIGLVVLAVLLFSFAFYKFG